MDPSGKDVCRAFFATHDPDLKVNINALTMPEHGSNGGGSDFRAGPHGMDDREKPYPWADIAQEKAEVTSLPMELPDILEGVRAFLSRYIVFSNEAQAPAVTLWAAHTWVIGAFYCTPYLHVSSPVRECGKSRLFGCLKHLCRNPWLAISPSEAVLFRKIHAHSPTILLDEIDTVFSDKTDPNKEGVRAVLNAGFERGATVPRCQGQSHELKDFSVFCPKAFAGIGNIPETVASRSIKIPMARRRKDQTVAKFRRRDVEQAALPNDRRSRRGVVIAG